MFVSLLTVLAFTAPQQVDSAKQWPFDVPTRWWYTPSPADPPRRNTLHRASGLYQSSPTAEGGAGIGGTIVHLSGTGIDLTATFTPDAPVDDNGTVLPAWTITGTVDGRPILTSGWAVTTEGGRLRLADADFDHPVICDGDWCVSLFLTLDPLEFGDGNENDDVAGGISTSEGGLLGRPHKRRIVTH